MKRLVLFTLALVSLTMSAPAADGVIPSIHERFAPPKEQIKEVPQFRQHIVPLLGKLGCNGRACHGSFQGQGGFRLSLFGYDFKMDHEGLTKGDYSRVDLESPQDSMIIEKPTMVDPHEGGLRYKPGSWEHKVFLRWIEGGAKGVDDNTPDIVRLDVTPSEILFQKEGQTAQMKVIAVWSDGSREDVTTLCRFQSNSSTVAEISDEGLVTAVNAGDTHIVISYDTRVVPIPVLRPVTELTGTKYPEVPTPTKVDQLVVQKLSKLGIVPSDLADDAEFLRRVSLDMTGTLPAPWEVEKFLADQSPDKRARKIDELLESPAYAAWWTTKLCDITGNNDDNLNNVTPVRGAASQEWYDWIHKRVSENAPYDELVAGIVLATSRNKGEDFMTYSKNMSELYRKDSKLNFAEDRETMPHYWARRNFRQPEERVIGFAYTFMGIRIQCAQCHKHPFDQWTQDDFKNFTGFFTNVSSGTNPEARDEYNELMKKLELGDLRGNQLRREFPRLIDEGKTVPFQEVYVRPARRQAPSNNRNRRNRDGATSATATLLGGEKIDLTKYEDAREPLMEWLRSKDNPYFARAFVNRVWAGYFNVGIVNPPDDLSLANPPSNKALLDYLTEGFIESGFDMKWVHREIANSRTYQLTWKPNDTNRLDEVNFSHQVPRRMPAEAAYDAIVQATASDDVIKKLHEELDDRAIAIPGAGRRSRGGAGYALTIFGRSIRESNCDCDRSSEASLLQTVFLQNDREVLSMIDNRNGWLAQVSKSMNTRFVPQTTPGPEDNGRDNRAAQRQIAQAREMIKKAEARLKTLEKEGKDEAAKELERKITQFKRRMASLRQRAGDNDAPQQAGNADKGEKVADFDPDQIIKQAYLRTLSRYPTSDELDRSREYVKEADETINGVRGLLWALVNTKEFIVNH